MKIILGCLLILCLWASPLFAESHTVNDIHSGLNATVVQDIVEPRSLKDIVRVVKRARRQKASISISSGRHAMGGQQFGEGTIHVSMAKMNRILRLDKENGILTVEAGAQWPEIVAYLHQVQEGDPAPWGVIQKQTGTSRLSIGGALSANAHGRGLLWGPIIEQVESFVLVNAQGKVVTCSRSENPQLFSAVIGGYGLFGIIAEVRLRLGPRLKVERVVEVIALKDLVSRLEARISEGYWYGDFQYNIDPSAEGFLREGIFPCYRPVSEATPLTPHPKELTVDDWRELFYLAHARPGAAYQKYVDHYVNTSGQVYWSDTADLASYLENYHREVDERLGSVIPGSEMITEIYVPRAKLGEFMEQVRADFLEHKVPVVYGTIRLIEEDTESFLAWARPQSICVIFNLHVDHSPEGTAVAATHFQRLIDRAITFKGNYYLTYHRWARKDQVLACYPQFVDFLRLKKEYDPEETFQSEWYRHYKNLFAEELAH